jgi:hypothetical protein
MSQPAQRKGQGKAHPDAEVEVDEHMLLEISCPNHLEQISIHFVGLDSTQDRNPPQRSDL